MSKKAKEHRKKIQKRNAQLAQQQKKLTDSLKTLPPITLEYVSKNYDTLIQHIQNPEVFKLLQELGPKFRESY